MNNNNNLRVIHTARTVTAINKAAQQGYRPLIKPVKPLSEIKSKYAVLQDQSTGEIEVINDYRADRTSEGIIKVIDWAYYYPYHFDNPFAAYLIPPDITIGERVWISDLIEDVVGQRWNQGDVYRLASCEAVWDGVTFVLKFNSVSTAGFVG